MGLGEGVCLAGVPEESVASIAVSASCFGPHLLATGPWAERYAYSDGAPGWVKKAVTMRLVLRRRMRANSVEGYLSDGRAIERRKLHEHVLWLGTSRGFSLAEDTHIPRHRSSGE